MLLLAVVQNQNLQHYLISICNLTLFDGLSLMFQA